MQPKSQAQITAEQMKKNFSTPATDDDMHASHQRGLNIQRCMRCGYTEFRHRWPDSCTACCDEYQPPGNMSGRAATGSRDLGLPANEGFTGKPKQAPSPPLLDEGVCPYDVEIVGDIAKPAIDRWTASLLFRYQAELLITVLRGRISPSTSRQRELKAWRMACQRTGVLSRMRGLPGFILLLELQEAKRIRRERIGAQGAARETDGLPHTRDGLRPHHGQPERAHAAEILMVRDVIKATTERIGKLNMLADALLTSARPLDVKAQVDEHIAFIEEPGTFPGMCMTHGSFRSSSGHCPRCVGIDPGHMDTAAVAMRTGRDAQHAAAEYGGLAPGCCSASSPCNFQKTNPRGICAVCTAAKHQRELDIITKSASESWNTRSDIKRVSTTMSRLAKRTLPRSGRWCSPR